jgi:hypothetical protein
MDTAAIALAISNILVAALIILLSIPLLKRQIPMNRWYGARFRKSFESEDNWYRINAYTAKQLILWSIPLLLIGILTFFLHLEGKTTLTILLACAPLLILVPAIISYRFAQKP